MPKITINIDIEDKRLKGLLCSALEGGSNYWYTIEDYDFGATGLTYKDFRKGGKMQDREDYWHPAQIIPFTDGCAVIIVDNEDEGGDGEGDAGKKTYRLDKAALYKGIQVMAEKFPRHYAEFATENDDANTGDAYLQCCLFGDVIYG